MDNKRNNKNAILRYFDRNSSIMNEVKLDKDVKLELFREYKLLEEERKLSINILSRRLEYYNFLFEITELFRTTIMIIESTIEKTIIPEMDGINAMAIAIQSEKNIISGLDLTYLKRPSPKIFKHAFYQKEALFLQNLRDFYTISVSFFTKDSISQLVNKDKIDGTAKKDFEEFKKNIQNKRADLNNYSIFRGN